MEKLQTFAAQSDHLDYNDDGQVIVQNSLGMALLVEKFPNTIEVDAPEPNPNCKQDGCYGRGKVGTNLTTGADVVCPKCQFPRVYEEIAEDADNEDAEVTASIEEAQELAGAEA